MLSRQCQLVQAACITFWPQFSPYGLQRYWPHRDELDFPLTWCSASNSKRVNWIRNHWRRNFGGGTLMDSGVLWENASLGYGKAAGSYPGAHGTGLMVRVGVWSNPTPFVSCSTESLKQPAWQEEPHFYPSGAEGVNWLYGSLLFIWFLLICSLPRC